MKNFNEVLSEEIKGLKCDIKHIDEVLKKEGEEIAYYIKKNLDDIEKIKNCMGAWSCRYDLYKNQREERQRLLNKLEEINENLNQ